LYEEKLFFRISLLIMIQAETGHAGDVRTLRRYVPLLYRLRNRLWLRYLPGGVDKAEIGEIEGQPFDGSTLSTTLKTGMLTTGRSLLRPKKWASQE
jgi:hypothetical protein